MDPKFTRQYEDEDSIVSAIMSATTSDQLTILQISNKHFLARNPEIHELLISMSHELREPIISSDELDWEG